MTCLTHSYKPSRERSKSMIRVPVQEFGEYKIRLMRDSEAPAVVDLYRAVYGDHFPVKEMYDSQFIIQQQEKGLMYRVVAVDKSDKVLACHAMYRLEEAYPRLYEVGQGMSLLEFRGKGLSNVLEGYIVKVLLPAVGIEECWGEVVTNHVYTQRSAYKAGARETGIEFDVMPAESYEAEKSATGRVSVVVFSVAFKEKPHTIYLPAPYAELLPKMYDHGKRKRQFELRMQALSAGIQTRYAETFIASAGLLRISIFEAGQDASDIVDGLVQKYMAAGAEVFQVFLPLDKSWSGALTETLNRRGFFYAAVVPRWFDADGLLLQRLSKPTQYDELHIDSDFSKDLLKFIIQDRTRVEAFAVR